MGKKPRMKSAEKKEQRRRKYRGAQRRTSVFFLLWTVVSAFTFFLVALLGITQQLTLSQAYKTAASNEVSRKGGAIERMVEQGVPDEMNGNWSGYLRFISAQYGVRVYILSENGRLIFPTEPFLDGDNSDYKEYFDFSEEVKTIKKEIEKTGEKRVLFEGDGEYVYAVKTSLYGETTAYLYVGESLELMEQVVSRINGRMVPLALFTLIFGFAVASALAGWLTKPLAEMTEKAHLLAQGDFSVDFHGVDYGQEMAELADTLNFARDELSKTDRMQKELIANVSHDFKTPLTMIKAYASMIMEISGDIPEKRNKHAQVIVDEADRLTSLVCDVLDLSKIRAGLSAFNKTRVDMSEKVRGIMDRFAYLKETQGYTFETEIEEGLRVDADEKKIEQALYNLIGNAVNYTGADKKVYVRLKRTEADKFRFEVQDTGKGIKSEEIAEIWDRYYRSKEMHKRPVQGTGLGLSIVKTVLQIHGFEFGVQSEVGVGSTFYVIFPLSEGDE